MWFSRPTRVLWQTFHPPELLINTQRSLLCGQVGPSFWNRPYCLRALIIKGKLADCSLQFYRQSKDISCRTDWIQVKLKTVHKKKSSPKAKQKEREYISRYVYNSDLY